MKTRFIITLAAVALAAACSSGTHGEISSAIRETSMASGSGMNTLTDADAAAIAHTIDDGEIMMAQLALRSASSQQVRDFAQMMITDHQNANRMLEEGGYAVVPNPVVEVLNTDVTRRMARLRALSGADFDRAYMTDQVELHRVALDTIKSTLLPSAQNARLEQTLTTMRDSVQTHLTHATTLQTSLGGATMP